jgi:hypothetical protein
MTKLQAKDFPEFLEDFGEKWEALSDRHQVGEFSVFRDEVALSFFYWGDAPTLRLLVEINSNGDTNETGIKYTCLYADFPFEDIPDTADEAYKRFEKACPLAFPGHCENIGAAYADFLQIIASPGRREIHDTHGFDD